VVQRMGDPMYVVEEHTGVGGALRPVTGRCPRDQRIDVRRQLRHLG
jgi:hypothetical protein